MTPTALLVLAMAFAGEAPSSTTPGSDSPAARNADWLARSPLAEVPAPGGATVRGGGGGSGGDHDEWRIRVETRESEVAVLEHYAAALAKLGYALRPGVVEGSVAMRTGTHVAANGTKWHVLLIASRGVEVETAQIHVSMRLTRLAEE